MLLSLFGVEAHARLYLKLGALASAGHYLLGRSACFAPVRVDVDLANKWESGAGRVLRPVAVVLVGARVVEAFLARVALDLVDDGREVVGLDSVNHFQILT